MMQSESAREKGSYRWAWRFIRPRLGGLAGVLALSLVTASFGLAQPLITKYLIDDGLLAGDMAVVLKLAGVLVGLAAGALALGAGNRALYVRASARILFDMRETVYRHLQRLSPAFYAERSLGDIMSRLDGDIAEVQRFTTDSALALVNAALIFAGSLSVMLALSWKLSLIAFAALPAQAVFLRFMRPRLAGRTGRVREHAGRIAGFLIERLGAMKFIQAVDAGERQAQALARLHRAYLGDLLRLQLTSYFTGGVPNFMAVLAGAAVFVAGGAMVINGGLSLGGLIAFSAYLARAAGPVNTLMGLYTALVRARVSLARLSELTDQTPAVDRGQGRRLPAGARGGLMLEGVSFTHPGRPEPVFEGLDLTIPAGAKVAVTGASGIGKSTLADLLHRHFDPDAGRILLDGVDLRALDLAQVRRAIAVVAQEQTILSGSITDNLRFVKPDASDAQLRRAAARAQLDEFIASLPEGYDTQLGQGGARLSGGQRQRLSIARALLQDPLVIILDEATAALDQDGEARLIEQIDHLFAARTRIIISHRAAPLKGADLMVEIRGKACHTSAGARGALP